MQSDVVFDMNWSKKLFDEQVWPKCSVLCGGGELMQMEGRPDCELAKLLDMQAGIDGWQIHSKGMRGIASRIQAAESAINPKTGSPWNSFTIRLRRDSGAKTEYEKRKLAVDSKLWLYPILTIQAYAETRDGPILSWGIAKTSDIIGFIDRGKHFTNRTTNAVFAVCFWAAMREAGFAVKTWEEIA